MAKRLNLFLLIIGLVSPHTSWALQLVEYYQAVVLSDVMREVSSKSANIGYSLKKIEHVASYRCPGCHKFEVTLEKIGAKEGEEPIVKYNFMTSNPYDQDYIVAELR